MDRTQKLFIVLSAISSLLFTACVILGSLIFGGVVPINHGYGVAFFIVAIVAFAVLMNLAHIIYKRFLTIHQLRVENQYVLGKPTGFYNLFEFENRVRVRRGSFANRHKRQFVVAFSFASRSITVNPRHNDEISAFNYAISEMLDQLYYGTEHRKSHFYNDRVYCFHRGEFMVYAFVEDEVAIREMCEKLSQEVYRLGKELNVRIVVQPFFGIYETNAKENITYAIDNAQIARSYGEESFDTITFFHDSFRVASSTDDITELERALDNQELVVYYQPKFSIKEKRFVSAEALVRWNSPKHGLLAPGSFIERAENAGLISQIDLYVFEHALIDIADERKKGHRVVPISVNFSLYEFFNPSFLNVITSLLDKYKVPAELIEVEITETTSQANQFMSISIIKKLKEKGVRVLMDDFGIGYSGIDNLRKIPFDAIKIDKSFTDQLLEDEKTRSIIKLLIELGHLNDIEVIIEGVDNLKQVEILKKLKIDTIQGFYYSRPIPLDEYVRFLKENPFEKKGGNKE